MIILRSRLLFVNFIDLYHILTLILIIVNSFKLLLYIGSSLCSAILGLRSVGH